MASKLKVTSKGLCLSILGRLPGHGGTEITPILFEKPEKGGEFATRSWLLYSTPIQETPNDALVDVWGYLSNKRSGWTMYIERYKMVADEEDGVGDNPLGPQDHGLEDPFFMGDDNNNMGSGTGMGDNLGGGNPEMTSNLGGGTGMGDNLGDGNPR